MSGGKTWEGLIGGVLAVTIYAALGAAVLGLEAAQWPLWLAINVAGGAVSVVGDLFESVLKREAGVKDSGTMLPGHGGLLDRLDSMLAGVPVLALGLTGVQWAAAA